MELIISCVALCEECGKHITCHVNATMDLDGHVEFCFPTPRGLLDQGCIIKRDPYGSSSSALFICQRCNAKKENLEKIT